MPMYGCICPKCGEYETIYRAIASRDDTPEHCGEKMQRIVEAPSVQVDIGGYTSPIDGRWIEGKAARREDLKRNNCRPWEGMESEKKEALKRAAAVESIFWRRSIVSFRRTGSGQSCGSKAAARCSAARSTPR